MCVLIIVGRIVRLAPNRYSIADAEAARAILGHGSGFDKSSYYLPFGSPFAPNMFTEPRLSFHGKMRRPIAQLYSNTNLLSYEPYVETCNKMLVNILKEHARKGDQFDMRELMQWFAFDVIGEITIGSRFGLMEDVGDKTGVVKSIDDLVVHGATFGLVPEAHLVMCYLATSLGYRAYIPGKIQLLRYNVCMPPKHRPIGDQSCVVLEDRVSQISTKDLFMA
jgi:hypothetical protein